jgi:multidrug efflux pump subunit AcrA (membrane-fusion protein)
MKIFNKKIMALVVIVCLVGGYYYFFANKKQKDVGSQTAIVQRGELLQRVTIAGVIQSLKTTIITAPYDGYIQRIYVKIGDKVKAGDPLVSVSQSLQATENVYPIRAPFGGTVVQILTTDGEFVKQGDVQNFIVRLDDISKLFVMANVPEIDIVKIKKNQEAIIKASPILDKTYKGIVRDISLAATTQTGSSNRAQAEYRVKLEVLDVDDLLKPGMSTILDIIPEKKTDVLILPHEYINKEGDNYSVTLKNGTKRDVKIGMQNETMVEIQEGLKEGDEIRQVDFIGLGQENSGAPSGRRKRR